MLDWTMTDYFILGSAVVKYNTLSSYSNTINQVSCHYKPNFVKNKVTKLYFCQILFSFSITKYI